jgi:hypothetical protein
MVGLSPSAQRRALQLQRDLIQRKIGSVEAEIALIEGSGNPEPGLFEQEQAGLESLRERLAELREMAKGIEQALKGS